MKLIFTLILSIVFIFGVSSCSSNSLERGDEFVLNMQISEFYITEGDSLILHIDTVLLVTYMISEPIKLTETISNWQFNVAIIAETYTGRFIASTFSFFSVDSNMLNQPIRLYRPVTIASHQHSQQKHEAIIISVYLSGINGRWPQQELIGQIEFEPPKN